MAQSDPVAERVRLGCGKALLTYLRRNEPELAARVLEALSEPTREVFESRNVLRWIPFAQHMELGDRIRDAVGSSEANTAISRHAFIALLARPMLRGFINSAMRLTSDPTGAVFERVPKLHDYLFDGIGTVRTVFTTSDHRVGRWSIEGFPDELHSFYCFLESACGAIEATASVVPHDLNATIESVGAGDASILVERIDRA
ncbi:MAG: hypothetical protein AAF411_03535 [Myxococcota bacterium]